MFKSDERKQVEGLARALDFSKRAGEFAANPPTGAQFVPFGIGAAFQQMFGLGGTVAALAATTATVRAYESKTVRELLMKLASVKQGSLEELPIVNRLGDVLKAQAAKVPTQPQQESK
jgi:hypothetical protein